MSKLVKSVSAEESKIFKKSILAVCNIVCGSKPGKTRSIWVLLFTDAGA